MELTHGSLFTGRGGFDEGAEVAGFKNIYHSEIDSWCNEHLKKRFPDAKQYGDIKQIKEVEKTTVISFGSPCQDISNSNPDASKGIFGEKSILFFEAIRIVGLSMPRYVIMENSANIFNRGLHHVLAAFTRIGYMCEWQCLQASDFGFPHKRKRIFIIAYPMCQRRGERVFRPTTAFELYQQWTPTETFVRVSGSRAKAFRDTVSIPASDVLSGFVGEIRSLGNAVMPVIAEYLFRCIKEDILIHSK